jgi:hypothetical protein
MCTLILQRRGRVLTERVVITIARNLPWDEVRMASCEPSDVDGWREKSETAK